MQRRILAAMAVAVLLSGLPSAGATSVDDARAVVRELGKASGRTVTRPTVAVYRELQRQSDRSGVEAHLDLSYGDHDLQGFDLFVPEEKPVDAMPVVVYLHGGGLTAGDKVSVASDGLLYNNIPIFFARNGMVGINMNYRLVPEVSWPAGAEDIRALMSWIRGNIGEFGGDPDRVFLGCNSAGCNHVATWLFHGGLHFDDGPGVAGAWLASGSYAPTNRDYYGDDQKVATARSVGGLLAAYDGPPVPLLLWSTEYDPLAIELGVVELTRQLCRKYEDCPEFMQIPGHNHTSDVASINSADDAVGHVILDFIHRTLMSRSDDND